MTDTISADVHEPAELETSLLALAEAGREHDMDDPAVIEAMELARTILVNVAIEDTRDRARALLLSSRASLARELHRARSGRPAAAWETDDQAPWYRAADSDLAAREGNGWGDLGRAALDNYNHPNSDAATWFHTGWDVARALHASTPDWRDTEIARLRAELDAR